MMTTTNGKRTAIIGGGLVGALQACFLAKRGYNVDLFEFRDDIRKLDRYVTGKSINLSLAVRGRAALAELGIEDEVLAAGTPMYGRMIHDLDGTQRSIPYGKKDQFNMSTDRRKLNEILLDELEKYPNVTMHFNRKLTKCDVEKGDCEFESTASEPVMQESFDLVCGCDGAFSATRKQVMRSTRFNYAQEYIPHGYIELIIPPTKDGEFAMAKNYLHIWPRGTFMMIGLPDKADKSFVMTLFMPFSVFDTIHTEEDAMNFFQTEFPDSIPLIGKDHIMKQLLHTKAQPLIAIKCSPYYVKDKTVLLGDAVHATVPFYGQGMNCGFEDCLVFNECMDKYGDNLAEVLPAYSKLRTPDGEGVVDLSMFNYIEMRHNVNTWTYLLRKKVDNLLQWIIPNTWVPLYTMVSFTRIRYSDCIAYRKWQDKILSRVLLGVGMTSFLSLSWLVMSKQSQIGDTASLFTNYMTQFCSSLMSSKQEL